MTAEKKILWITSAAVVAIVLVMMLSGSVEQKLAPRPLAAWVAIEVEGTGLAVTEPQDLAAGREFFLHAVLEAESWTGDKVYYTEAPALEIAGRRIPEKAMKRWDRPETLRVLWFTVEGVTPYLELESLEGAEALGFQDSYRSDWPMTWSIPGELEPSAEGLKPAGQRSLASGFGTQRFHLRIEIFGPESRIVPRQRLRTPGAADVFREAGAFPGVTASLSGALSAPSRLFGLTQIVVQDEATGDSGALLADWTRRRLAFSRATVIQGLLADAATDYSALEWMEAELTGVLDWSPEGVLPGDLVRVGERLVILFEDHGRPGVLDYEDFCFDYEKGANVRALGDVFVGEGVVELARLPRADDGADGGGGGEAG